MPSGSPLCLAVLRTFVDFHLRVLVLVLSTVGLFFEIAHVPRRFTSLISIVRKSITNTAYCFFNLPGNKVLN